MKHFQPQWLLLSGLMISASCTDRNSRVEITATQEVNDANTPLHLLQPDYDNPYGIPSATEVKAVMDRVLNYITDAMPAAVDDSLRLVQGKFRLTSYECGVTYAAALSAYSTTRDSSYLRFVDDRCQVIAELAPKVEERIKTNPTFDPQMRRVVAPSALDDAGAMAAAMIRLQMEGQERQAYEPLIERYVSYIMNKEYRLGDGTFARNRPHHNTVWLDDMYMAIPALASYGRYKQDLRYTD